jgi:large subunit ribosomal protein L10
MNRDEKQVFIDELHGKLAGASAIYLTDFTGMSVKRMTEFRRRLRKQDVEYVIVKNTLAQRALTGLDMPDVGSSFTGPTGLVFGRDPVAAAKVLSDFNREFDNKPAIKLGIVERKGIAADQVKVLATMPPREVLLAQLAGGLQAPMARLAGGMQQVLASFARAVDALRQQRDGAGGTAPAEG